jgi:sugar/nucleoside kinase (ribokinase family)
VGRAPSSSGAPRRGSAERVSGPSFVAVGDVMIDIAAAGRGHEASVAFAAGGSAVNAALSAAAAGAEATVVGRVGDDLAGRAVRTAIEDGGARAELSVDPSAATGTFLLVDGEIRADRGANATFGPDALSDRIEADCVLVSGYLPAPTVAAALERAGADRVALAPASLRELPPGADALLLDEEEARRLTGADAEEAARRLGGDYRLVCVTRGAAGAVGVLDGRLEAAAVPAVEAGRPFGAGDAFAAGLLVALGRGADLAEALAAGCALGANAVRVPA